MWTCSVSTGAKVWGGRKTVLSQCRNGWLNCTAHGHFEKIILPIVRNAMLLRRNSHRVTMKDMTSPIRRNYSRRCGIAGLLLLSFSLFPWRVRAQEGRLYSSDQLTSSLVSCITQDHQQPPLGASRPPAPRAQGGRLAGGLHPRLQLPRHFLHSLQAAFRAVAHGIHRAELSGAICRDRRRVAIGSRRAARSTALTRLSLLRN